jgi:hypothetical protein
VVDTVVVVALGAIMLDGMDWESKKMQATGE